MRIETVVGSKLRNTSVPPRILGPGKSWSGGARPMRIASGSRWAASSSSRRRRWREFREVRYRYPTITESMGGRGRAALLRIWDLDFHEVLGDPHVPEDLLCVLEDGRRVLVARTAVREDEDPDTRFLRDRRGLPRRRMPIAVRLLLQRRIRGRIMDQDVRSMGNLHARLVRHRVSGIHDLASSPRRPEHVLRPDRTVSDSDCLSFLQPAVEGSARHSKRFRPVDAEAPRARLLLEGVGVAGHRVDRLERLHGVLAAVDLSAGRELLGSDREARREIPEGEEFAHEPLDPPRPVDLERDLASVHGHALDHAGQSEEMVSVEMGEEDAGDLHEAEAALHELPLRPFAAVEQHDLRASFHRDGTHVSLRSGPRTRGPQEHDLHGLAPERPQALNAFGTRVPLVYVQVPSRPRTPSREMNLDARRKESRGTNAMRSSRTVSFRRWRWTWVPASFP